METKVCTRCNQSLPLDAFVKDKNKRDGHASLCKPCNSARLLEFRNRNPEHMREYGKRWYRKNLEKRREHGRNARRAIAAANRANPPAIPETRCCPACQRTKPSSAFYRSIGNADGLANWCKECASAKQAAWRLEHPDLAAQKDKRSWATYRARYQENYKKWVADNRPQRNAYRNKLHAQNMRDDPNYRIAKAIRGRIGLGMAGLRKSAPTERLLGCSFEECRLHIEKQWEPWMSWDNYGKGHGTWQIDHRVPVCAFDLREPEQQRLCFHFSNLTPMCSVKNRNKWNTFNQADMDALKAAAHPP